MKTGQYLAIVAVVLVVAALLYAVIPPGFGIKGQLRWLGQGALWAIGFVFWLVEAVILFIGPWFLGWLGRWGIEKADETVTPDQELTRFQGFLLNLGVVVVVFLLWIFAAIAATWVPPMSTYIIGPWIRGHVETGLVWWGVYGALSYMLFSPLRAVMVT